MSYARSASAHPARIAGRGWWLLILAAPLLVTACGSSTPQSSEPASQPVSPPLIETIAATPPDVPLFVPECNSTQNLTLTNGNPTVATAVPAALQGLESTCSNYAGDDPEVMVIYNLTDDVLDVSPAGETSPVIVPHSPVPAGILPSWDALEIDAQNQVVQARQADAAQGTYLIPVGGQAVVYLNGSYPSLDVNVTVDQGNSALSYGAQLLTGYVTDNLLDKISALSFISSIADCANAAYSLWQDLDQHADAATTVITALQTIPACTKLAGKVRANRAEALAAASAKDDLSDQILGPDLDKVADTAHASTWETKIADLAAVNAEIEEVVR